MLKRSVSCFFVIKENLKSPPKKRIMLEIGGQFYVSFILTSWLVGCGWLFGLVMMGWLVSRPWLIFCQNVIFTSDSFCAMF